MSTDIPIVADFPNKGKTRYGVIVDGETVASCSTWATAYARALRLAHQRSQPIEIDTDNANWHWTRFRRVQPDGSVERWEKGEWLRKNERHTADGRIVTVESEDR